MPEPTDGPDNQPQEEEFRLTPPKDYEPIEDSDPFTGEGFADTRDHTELLDQNESAEEDLFDNSVERIKVKEAGYLGFARDVQFDHAISMVERADEILTHSATYNSSYGKGVIASRIGIRKNGQGEFSNKYNQDAVGATSFILPERNTPNLYLTISDGVGSEPRSEAVSFSLVENTLELLKAGYSLDGAILLGLEDIKQRAFRYQTFFEGKDHEKFEQRGSHATFGAIEMHSPSSVNLYGVGDVGAAVIRKSSLLAFVTPDNFLNLKLAELVDGDPEEDMKSALETVRDYLRSTKSALFGPAGELSDNALALLHGSAITDRFGVEKDLIDFDHFPKPNHLVSNIALEPGDRIILVTDGAIPDATIDQMTHEFDLSRRITLRDIAAKSDQFPDVKEFAEAIIFNALIAGSRDDISVAIHEVSG